MRKSISTLLLLTLLLPATSSAQIIFPNRGGTGTSIAPSAGYVLVGQANGTYLPQATSTLGIAGGAGGSSEWNDAGNFVYPKEGDHVRAPYFVGTSTTATSSAPRFSVSTAFDFLGTYITNVSTWFAGLFNTNFAAKTTTDLTEGSNLYYTTARVNTDAPNVSLAGTPDYLTLSGQQITRGAIDLLTDVTGTLPDDNGGTGQSTYATGDMLYASAANTLAKRSIGSTGNVLSVSGGVPTWVATSTLGITSSPGGSDTQLQYNNAGAFGGISGATTDGTNVTFGDQVYFGNRLSHAGDLGTEIQFANDTIYLYADGVLGLTVQEATTDVITTGTGWDLRLTTAGTNAASAVSVGGTQTLTNKTLTSPTLGTNANFFGDTISDLTGLGLAVNSGALGLNVSGAADGECLSYVSAGPSIDWVACSGGGGGGGGGLSTTSPWTAGNLAYVTSNAAVGSVATGTLTENVSGLEFSSTRALVGGSAVLSLSSGYTIPLAASTTAWQTFYTTPSNRITAGTGLSWAGNTLNGHVAATLAGQDYLSISGQEITALAINPDNLASVDFGSFTCNGTNCTVDSAAISNAMLANSTVSYGGVSLALGGTDATPAFNLADATGLPISTGVSGLGTGVATFLATPSSANLATAVTGETGSGALVFGTSPTLSSPTLSSFFGTPCTGQNFLQDISDTGAFTCAEATGSGGSSEWNDAGSFLYPKEGDYVSAPRFVATSTTAASSIAYRLGIGTTTPAKLIDVRGDISGGIAQFTRTPTSAVNSSYGTFNIKSVHDGDMGNGFGTALQFMVQDNANVEQTIANIQATRAAGADNSGRLVFTTYNTGASRVSMMIEPDGNIAIGSSSAPTSMLEVTGDSGGILNLVSSTGTVFLEMLNNGYTTLLGTWDFVAATLRIGRTIVDTVPAADHTATGPTADDIDAGATVSAFELLVLLSDGELHRADADAAATSTGMLAIALEAGTDNNPIDVALPGAFVRDDTWNWTVGGKIYVSTTAGALTQTAPSGTDDVVRVVGYALTADVIYFDPDNLWIELN